MTRKLIFYFTFLAFLFAFSNSFAEQTRSSSNADIKWHNWSNETFRLAQQQNKLVLLDISAPWCQFCKKMKSVTYQDPDVINIINKHYIAIHADIEANHAVKKRYGTFGVPGTVVLTSSQQELNKRLGYIPPQQMQWHLLGSLQDSTSAQLSTKQITKIY